jgi:excisionase family DNA binding protein
LSRSLLTAPVRALTPVEAARQLGVSPDKIRGFIAAGELRASNLAMRQGGRPRWRIAPVDLEEFLARRSAVPRPRRTRRRKEQAEVIQFF